MHKTTYLKKILLGVMATGLVLVGGLTANGGAAPAEAAAVQGPVGLRSTPQSSIGYPTFTGDADPVKSSGVTVGNNVNQLDAIYYADQSAGAGMDYSYDYWIDRMLARTGPGYDSTENLVAFTRGKAVFMKTHQPTQLGWGGDVAYWETLSNGGGFTYSVAVGSTALTFSEVSAQRKQTPSYFYSQFNSSSLSLSLAQTKFITENNVMVALIELKNNGTASRSVTFTATSNHATQVSGNELIGSEKTFSNLTTVYPRFSGNNFTAADGKLTRTVTVAAGATAELKLQLGFITDENPDSLTEYNTFKGISDLF
ncbi:MAG: hypothetical protein LBR19_09215, partial [Bifidobacteriaceae bacterium]|nr:hypothetical protein [Bifidobacteriaceae bacterium]